VAGSQVLLLTSYLCQWTRYFNFLQLMLELTVPDYSNSYFPSTLIEKSDIWNLLDVDDSLYSSTKKTWNIRLIFIEVDNLRQNATLLICLMTRKALRWQKSNLLHCQLVLKLRQSNYTLSPIWIIGCFFQD
jgi:hypothetical protein